ncbi:acyltransferase family protein [Xanthobacter tagetidis]|nr:acyltransferase family protein [Xanthobacter tagetidis]MBB6307568.1 peptidoglycan/LPS O-acetylase OafA/YrhL [Xanthobacter tagetidis]
MKYRADIDGLRCVAVVPVVLYHAGLSLMPGGFVGVDVFFVISGFLITSIIYNEMVQEKFSFVSFYDRRVRRIFPALYFVLFVSSIFALVILIPVDLVGYGNSMIYTTLFASNFYFWSTAGYFAEASETLPLLHTWSLAVEEQFYLLFPPVLLLVLRLIGARWLAVVLLVGAGVSLAASAWGVFAVPRLTFYLLPTRAWELLIGSLIAVPFLPKIPARLGSALAASGLVMIAAAILTIDGTMPFPGITALLPCIGAGLVIYGGMWSSGGLAKSVLEWAPVVYVGRLSYSLYLWHWPVLVFGRLYLGRSPSAAEAVALVALSFALAAFSLRFVEAPFRGANSLGGRPWLRLGAGAGLIAVTSAVALTFTLNHGLPGRVSQETLTAEAVRWDRNALRQRCLVDSPFSFSARQKLPPIEGCLAGPGAAGQRYEVVVWGDSQADSLVPAVVDMVAARGWTVREIAMEGCPPLIGADLVVVKQDLRGDRCKQFNTQAIEMIRNSPGLKLVVVAGRWSVWSEGGSVPADPRYSVDEISGVRSLDNSRRVFARSLEASVRQITETGVAVLLMGQVPEYEHSPWRCAAYARLRGHPVDACKIGERNVVAAPMQYSNTIIRQLAKDDPLVSIVLPTEVLCEGERCYSGRDGIFYYINANHLTSSGARHVLSVFTFDPKVGGAGGSPN